MKTLRGADLTRIHTQAIERLNELDISTTLVMTLKKDLNDGEIGKIIDYGLSQPCVRGVTLAADPDAGRVEAYDAKVNRLTVSEIRRRIAEQTQAFTLSDIIPVPCNPDTLAMGYALQDVGRHHAAAHAAGRPANPAQGRRATPLPSNTTRPSRNRSSSCSPPTRARTGRPRSFRSCCAAFRKVETPPGVGYRDVFRVLIVQFMDALSLDIRALKKSCIHIAQPDGRLIPFQSFNMFYRDGLSTTLETLRAEVAASTERRRAPLS